MSEKAIEGKRPPLWWAVLTFVLPICVILVGSIIIGLRPPILPIIAAIALAAVMCLMAGSKWDDLEQGMFDSLRRVLIAVYILILVGMVISSWIACGTIPMIVYWGLKLISPEHFPVSSFLLCAVTAIVCGTSTATIGTVGVALLGIGVALGYSPGVTVGAVVAGSYFGDKMSPISDTTNIAASVCEVPLFQHIGSMLWTTVPALLVSVVMYVILGQMSVDSLEYSADDINILLTTLEANFSMSWYVLLPPIIMVTLAYMRFPVLPVMAACLVAAILICVFEGIEMKAIGNLLTSGYKSATGVKQVDVLLTRGGILSMAGTVIILMCGVSFGGLLERARVLEVMIEAMLKGATGHFRLILCSLFAGFLINLGTGAQLLAVIVPGRAFAQTYRDHDLHAAVLSRSCEDTGTLSCPLIPWSIHTFGIIGMVGVSAYEYAPYAFLNWLVPIFSIICAITGFGIWRRDGTAVRGRNVTPEPNWTREQKGGAA